MADDDTGSEGGGSTAKEEKKHTKQQRMLIIIGIVSLVLVYVMIRRSASSSSNSASSAQAQQLAAYEQGLSQAASYGAGNPAYAPSYGAGFSLASDPTAQEMLSTIQQIQSEVATNQPSGAATSTATFVPLSSGQAFALSQSNPQASVFYQSAPGLFSKTPVMSLTPTSPFGQTYEMAPPGFTAPPGSGAISGSLAAA